MFMYWRVGGGAQQEKHQVREVGSGSAVRETVPRVTQNTRFGGSTYVHVWEGRWRRTARETPGPGGWEWECSERNGAPGHPKYQVWKVGSGGTARETPGPGGWEWECSERNGNLGLRRCVLNYTQYYLDNSAYYCQTLNTRVRDPFVGVKFNKKFSRESGFGHGRSMSKSGISRKSF
jgi:hypothetical protein